MSITQIIGHILVGLLVSMLIVIWFSDRWAERIFPFFLATCLAFVVALFIAFVVEENGSVQKDVNFRGRLLNTDSVSEHLSEELKAENPGLDIWVEVHSQNK